MITHRLLIAWCVIIAYGHSAYGVSPASLSLLAGQPIGYAQALQEQGAPLVYLNARYYHVTLMRFINRDTYDLTNRFSYVEGNPIHNDDPSGHVTIAGLIGPIGDHGECPTFPIPSKLVKKVLTESELLEEFSEGAVITHATIWDSGDNMKTLDLTLPENVQRAKALVSNHAKTLSSFNIEFTTRDGSTWRVSRQYYIRRDVCRVDRIDYQDQNFRQRVLDHNLSNSPIVERRSIRLNLAHMRAQVQGMTFQDRLARRTALAALPKPSDI